MSSIIQAENLSKFYPPKTKAVDNVSFSVEEGEVFGFLGPNRAGKTTIYVNLYKRGDILNDNTVISRSSIRTVQHMPPPKHIRPKYNPDLVDGVIEMKIRGT